MSSTPVIIGVADLKNRDTTLAAAHEPLSLIHSAVLSAISDASPSSPTALQSAIDSIDIVKTWTWPYPDLPGSLAEKLGVSTGLRWKRYSEHGGNTPGLLVDEACKRVARGEVRVAVVGGGEALASLSACAAAKQLPPPGWTAPEQAVDSVFTPTGRDLGTNLGAIHQIGAPIHIYPLYENAFRAHRGQSLKANHEESAKLYAEFSKVASENPVAWNYGKYDDEKKIGTVDKKNRMICFPYPLLMNAFNTINLAGALLITSVSVAQSLGIPPHKYIYPLGGAGTKDSDEFWLRPNFHTSPSISRSLDAALTQSRTTASQIDLFDFYSCFPIVPKLAAQHLGLPILGSGKPFTLLGGLTSFGGAGNNYSMHAFTEMTRQLRDGKGKNGLVLCNGGVLSYQHVVVLSREKGETEYPLDDPLPYQLKDVPAPEIAKEAEGSAIVETYTVEFSRDGSPLRGYIVGRLKSNNKRFLANHGDESTLKQMANGTIEIVGRSGRVWQDKEKKGRGLFVLDDERARI